MKEFIKQYLKISTACNLVIYLMWSFCLWDVLAPIDFFSSMGEKDVIVRVFTLTCIILINGPYIAFSLITSENKKNKIKSEKLDEALNYCKTLNK
jgi:hypothetical protein